MKEIKEDTGVIWWTELSTESIVKRANSQFEISRWN